MSPLHRRILTAALLVPAVVAGILLLPTAWFAGAVGVFVVAGGWEWAGLAGSPGRLARAGAAAGAAALLVVAWLALASPLAVVILLGAGCLWWVVAAGWIVWREHGREPPGLGSAPVRWLAGAAVLVPAWTGLVWIHTTAGPGRVLLLLVLVWTADTGAYFAGRRFGRRRLAPRTSPGKTWEGVLGGVGLAGLVAAGIALAQRPPALAAGAFVVLCLATVGASVLGDLLESLFKRRAGVKDSGALFPGHGGVLDRIDSVTAAAPVFALGLPPL